MTEAVKIRVLLSASQKVISPKIYTQLPRPTKEMGKSGRVTIHLKKLKPMLYTRGMIATARVTKKTGKSNQYFKFWSVNIFLFEITLIFINSSFKAQALIAE